MSTPHVYRFCVFVEDEAGNLIPVLDPENGFQVGRASTVEDVARLRTMAEADALAEANPDARYVVLDSEGRECYVASPLAAPF